MAEYEKRGYLLENFRLFHLRSDGGAQTDFHYHEFCKLLFLLSGHGGYYVGDRRYLLRSGDIVCIPSHQVHKPELDSQTPYERIIIYISPEYLCRISTEDCDLLSVFARSPVLRPGEAERKQLFSLASSLERDLSRSGFGQKLLSEADLTRLLVALGRTEEHGDGAAPDPITAESRRVLEIMAYLDRNLTEDITIDLLAETFFISKYYMMRAFRRETGITIYSYLTQKRLLLAREKIAGGMSATEACYSCGFRNYSSFTRSYGKFFGTSPTGRSEKKLIREAGFE